MTIPGWAKMYAKIVNEFGYDVAKDQESAVVLESVIKESDAETTISKMIREKTVFVVGAGPSLSSATTHIKRCIEGKSFALSSATSSSSSSSSTSKKNVKTKKIESPTIVISADSATQWLVKNKIIPDIIVTDLDGDLELFESIAHTQQTIFVVHAHADNQDKLHMAKKFRNCIGTAQTECPPGKIHNFGGFTDGDRAVFLASHYGADKIILFGMDFGDKVGRHSKTEMQDREIKIAKLKKGRELLECLAVHTKSKLYTTSKPIQGFEEITYDMVDSVMS